MDVSKCRGPNNKSFLDFNLLPLIISVFLKIIYTLYWKLSHNNNFWDYISLKTIRLNQVVFSVTHNVKLQVLLEFVFLSVLPLNFGILSHSLHATRIAKKKTLLKTQLFGQAFY